MNEKHIIVFMVLSNAKMVRVCVSESVLINNPIWPFVSVCRLYFIYFNSVWKVRLRAVITRCELS